METQYCREDRDYSQVSDDVTPEAYQKLSRMIRAEMGMSDYIDMD